MRSGLCRTHRYANVLSQKAFRSSPLLCIELREFFRSATVQTLAVFEINNTRRFVLRGSRSVATKEEPTATPKAFVELTNRVTIDIRSAS
jgi:hypothetical protein